MVLILNRGLFACPPVPPTLPSRRDLRHSPVGRESWPILQTRCYGLGVNAFFRRARGKDLRPQTRDPGQALVIVVADSAQARSVAKDLPPPWISWPGRSGPARCLRPECGPPLSPGDAGRRRHDRPARSRPALALRTAAADRISGHGTSANLSGDNELDEPDEVRRIFEGRTELIRRLRPDSGRRAFNDRRPDGGCSPPDSSGVVS